MVEAKNAPAPRANEGVADDRKLPPDLQELVAQVRDRQAGFFGPGSYAWRLLRENTIQLAGPYAALMQVAHPQVAQGVFDHSAYDTDPVGRLERTFVAVHRIVFGSVNQALDAVMQARNMHRSVSGVMPAGSGTGRYHANRGDLLLWVHATLVEGSILGHGRFIRQLAPSEKEGLYQELKIFGRLFGIPLADYPPDYPAFQGYYADMIENRLDVTEAAREISHNIIWNAGYYRAISPLILLLAAGLLPEKVRRQFNLPWNRAMQMALDAFSTQSKMSRALVPARFLYRPAYLGGLRRTHQPLVRDRIDFLLA